MLALDDAALARLAIAATAVAPAARGQWLLALAAKNNAPPSDTAAVFSAAETAITAAQDDAVKGFIDLRTKR